MTSFRSSLTILAAFSLLAATPMATAQAETTLNSKIKLSFLGLGIGTMYSTAKIWPQRYAVSGSVKTSGVASLVSKTTANISSYGSILGARVVPDAHALNFKTRKKSGSVNMKFASGNVASHASTPKVKYKDGATPLKRSHLNAVLDPLSSIVFPVAAGDIGNGRKICNRTIPIFDGKARMNLVSRYKGSKNSRAKGFKGKTFTCSVRYQPISGMRKFKKNVKFMKANRNMEITVARVGNTNVYTLFGFKVKTQRGTAKGYATTFAAK